MRRKANSPALPPAPTIVNGNVPPRRVTNAARRPREYLTREEVELLITAAA